MKVRTDFVSNSSSSSFILAKKGELSDKQKAAIIRYVEETMMGRPLPLIEEGEELEDFCDRIECWISGDVEELRRLQQEGMTLYGGTVNFEGGDDHYSGIFQEIWNIMEKEDGGSNFKQIDTDLMY